MKFCSDYFSVYLFENVKKFESGIGNNPALKIQIVRDVKISYK